MNNFGGTKSLPASHVHQNLEEQWSDIVSSLHERQKGKYSSTIRTLLSEQGDDFSVQSSLSVIDKTKTFFTECVKSRLYKRLKTFQNDIQTVFTLFQPLHAQLQTHLAEIRKSPTKTSGFKRLISTLQSSVFGTTNSIDWISKKEVELDELEGFMPICEVHVRYWNELPGLVEQGTEKTVLCLVISNSLIADPVIRDMKANTDAKVSSRPKLPGLSSTIWWITNMDLREKVLTHFRRFIECTRANTDADVQFAFHVDDDDSFLPQHEIAAFFSAAKRWFQTPV